MARFAQAVSQRNRRRRIEARNLAKRLTPFKQGVRKTRKQNRSALTVFFNLLEEAEACEDGCNGVWNKTVERAAKLLSCNKSFLNALAKSIWDDKDAEVPYDQPRAFKKLWRPATETAGNTCARGTLLG